MSEGVRLPGPTPRRVDGPGRGQDRHAHHQPQLGLQAPGAEQALERAREAPGEKNQGPLEHAPAFQPADHGGSIDPLQQMPLECQVENETGGHRRQAHHQRPVEAVPDRQAVLGRGRTEGGMRRHVQVGPNRSRREDADDDAGEHEDLHREPHPGRRFVRRVRQIHRVGAEEGAVDEAQGVGNAEGARHRGGERQHVDEQRRRRLG